MASIDMEIHVQTELGIAPSEQGREQRLTVALHVELDPSASHAASRSGSLSDTLDYGELRRIVIHTFAERRWRLLEQLTSTIRERVLELPHVLAVRIGITKHHPWADVPRLTLTR